MLEPCSSWPGTVQRDAAPRDQVRHAVSSARRPGPANLRGIFSSRTSISRNMTLTEPATCTAGVIALVKAPAMALACQSRHKSEIDGYALSCVLLAGPGGELDGLYAARADDVAGVVKRAGNIDNLGRHEAKSRKVPAAGASATKSLPWW
ncbi:hypothetical protein EXIGLDRAFT_348856 [Exidia glandulosa HHB12029]|uniref:Uncharacterized protein n=1 Tax=Exidia glandulosa HHB12029 TaxID=1314781 RepID=A0A165LFS2_EXIGL|nr:hypothetical protein EXIGLDRAFT_348856 [Exidia glandulosa HHB12029]